MSAIWISAGIIWLLFGVSAAVVASGRGGSATLGFVLGFLFGPFGLIFAWFSGDAAQLETDRVAEGTHKHCPDCAELVRQQARVCRYCGFDFSALTLKRTA